VTVGREAVAHHSLGGYLNALVRPRWYATVFLVASACSVDDGVLGGIARSSSSGYGGSTGLTEVPDSSKDSSAGAPSASDCSVAGPTVTLTDPTNDATRESCTGQIAATFFLNALCTCHAASFGISLETHGFDSSRGTYQPGQTDDSGASVGINDDYVLSKESTDVRGSLSLAGSGDPQPIGSMQVLGDLRIAQDIVVAGSVSVARNAWLGGSFIGVGTFTVAGDLHHQGDVIALSVSAQNEISEAVSVPKPCACENQDLLDVNSLVDSARTANDNAQAKVSSSALASVTGPTQLTLPCGRYYLDRIRGSSDVSLKATGSVAIFVGGSVDLDANLDVELASGTTIDIFVGQQFNVTGQVTVGSKDRPAAGRIYVGASSDITLTDTFIGNLYAPTSNVTASRSLDVWGSIFCSNFQSSSDASFVYDRYVLTAGTSCEVPQPAAGACSKCGWCSGGTACVNGTCGPCRTDDDCCSQSVCSNGSCEALVVLH
jgi:hypothetical protein